MTSRRSFIRHSASLLGTLALHGELSAAFPDIQATDPENEEDFWRQIRMAYAASPTVINLNNGGVCPMPRATMDALDYYTRMSSEAPSYYMWRVLEQDREPLRENLAALVGASPEEVAVSRNATESLNAIIFGLPLAAGDEVVLSKYDYPNMMNAWKQREKRDGIRLVWVDVDLPSEDEQYLTQAYTSKFTEKTKLVHLTHIVNWSGQILPVRKIADKAHAQGIEVLVDGAHSLAVLDYKIPDLHCDYWGASLHKFLCGPYGSGMTWVAKEKIAKLWPLLGSDKPESDNIRKFESIGTRSFPTEMAIGYSLDLHNLIGAERKQKRLHFLKNYWLEQVHELPGVRPYTSLRPEWGCAIGNIGIEGRKANDLVGHFWEKHKIHVVGIEWEKINGVRITPNVYTTTQELDKLVKAIKSLINK